MGAYGGFEEALAEYADPQPLSGVTIQGPTAALAQANCVFTATVEPVTASLPITYVWQASGQETVTRTGGLSDVIAFDWSTGGDKNVTVTATNAGDSVVDSHTISILVPPESVTITGPGEGTPGVAYVFTATVEPLSTTLPITYVWQASGQEPITRTGGLSDLITFSWPITGDKQITVTASNAAGPVEDSHSLSLVAPEYRIYLPLVSKGPASWALNRSYPTTCAEEDNVNVPVFAPGTSHFSITATHPTYEIGVDNCDPDFSGCATGSVTSSPSADTCMTLFDDGIHIVEGCLVTDWWRPGAMGVTVGGGGGKFHYLVLYKKTEGAASWPQFLVLYADGNMRLKPHPRPGQADVCFGSSVIVGPVVAASSIRPYVDIQLVEVDPASQSLEVTYKDGGSAHIDWSVDRVRALAEVEINYAHDHTAPLAAFRSMFVADGNADVDTVTNPTASYPILGSWKWLEGPYWSFTRTTRSQHNTSAPDIRLEVVQ
jgi:PKD repeat protein